MASIKKIEGKTGTSYKITVTKGRDSSGKQIRHFKTWTPDRPMTARQMEKEVQRVAVEFEREIELGFQADNRQTFEQYANYVLDLKKRQGVSNNTIVSYEKALKRAFPSIGYMKLGSIRPQHLNKLYRSLEEPGARNTRDKAVAKVDLVGLIESKYPSRKAFSRRSEERRVGKECS